MIISLEQQGVERQTTFQGKKESALVFSEPFPVKEEETPDVVTRKLTFTVVPDDYEWPIRVQGKVIAKESLIRKELTEKLIAFNEKGTKSGYIIQTNGKYFDNHYLALMAEEVMMELGINLTCVYYAEVPNRLYLYRLSSKEEEAAGIAQNEEKTLVRLSMRQRQFYANNKGVGRNE